MNQTLRELLQAFCLGEVQISDFSMGHGNARFLIRKCGGIHTEKIRSRSRLASVIHREAGLFTFQDGLDAVQRLARNARRTGGLPAHLKVVHAWSDAM